MQLLGLAAGLGCLALGIGCGPARWHAREELAPETTLPVVYNQGYNIDIFGFENLTLFDAHRYEKIYRALLLDKIPSISGKAMKL